VYVQARGAGSEKHKLHIGMSVRELNDLLKDQPAEQRYVDNPTVSYLFLPELGVGVRLADGQVREIVVAQVPRKQGF
jgi:hypothetical protein